MLLTLGDSLTLGIGLTAILALTVVALVLAYFVLRNQFCPPTDPPPPLLETNQPIKTRNGGRPADGNWNTWWANQPLPKDNASAASTQNVAANPQQVYMIPTSMLQTNQSSVPMTYESDPVYGNAPVYPASSTSTAGGPVQHSVMPPQQTYLSSTAKPIEGQARMSSDRVYFNTTSVGYNPAYQPDELQAPTCASHHQPLISKQGYYTQSLQ